MSNKTFQYVGGLKPSRSVFDLSYEKKFTCDMGQLIPIVCDEMIPGDTFKFGNDIIIRFQPLVAPIMHEINVYVHYFFVPNRILWEDWEDFITGGVDGDFAGELPRWNPTPTTGNAIGSLWDFLGLPTGIVPTGALPVDFPRRAYARIYNEYYRDETLIEEVDEDQELILNRCWEKDYFTSALPWQQRGTAPALPISGVTSAVWDNQAIQVGTSALYVGTPSSFPAPYLLGSNANAQTNILNAFNDNTVDLSSATTFNVSDLRLAFQIQKWLERNARAGARYTEFLRAHFGISPRDERMQRPEYIGGSKSPLIISEVLQTSSTDATSAQGNLAGHGLAVDSTFAGTFTAPEFGWIMGIMSVMPRSAYQQGIDRQFLRRTKYDYPFPEFVNLSEQAIERAEIYATAVEAENVDIWGYQGRYDELRIKRSMVCSEMRSTFDFWHLGRQFGSAPELNGEFLTCVPRKDIFAVPSKPGLIVNVGNRIRAIRPLPIIAEPGLIDHH